SRSTFSIMRRRFVGGVRRVSLCFLQPLAQGCDLARQRVDLEPLRGDGLVQRLDGLVLKHQPGFERIDTVAERIHVTHSESFSNRRSRNPWPSATRSSKTKHSPRQRLSASGTLSRY